jgi:hypothetical protein
MNNRQLIHEDIESFLKDKKLRFYKRAEYFHATNGITSATDVFQDLETKELFEISWSKEFENKNLVTKYSSIKQLEYDYHK